MKLRSIAFCFALMALTASCAHKETLVLEGHHTTLHADKKVEPKKEETKNHSVAYTCLVDKDKRTVTLDRKKNLCEVKYTKFGDTQKVAWAESTPAICDRAFNSIRSNIEGSGYKCQEGLDFKLKKQNIEEKKTLKTAATEK